MKVVIAEKPRMAQAIADALNVPRSTTRGVFENSEFCVVSCQGHVITEYEPHDYNETLKNWTLESLPILPDEWKVKPISGKERFISTIQYALNKASVVYAAGDPDAAGQRIVDEVLAYLRWSGEVLRPLINDLNPEPIRRAVANAESNELERFRGLYRKEVSRARGDWLLGMNLTRLYTLLGNQYGLDILFSAGRVQSAALGLVVKRDTDILNFKPHDYYSIESTINTTAGEFEASWVPSEGQEGLDSDGRLVSPSVAEQLSQSAPCAGHVVFFEEKAGAERAPLPFSMSELQKHASKKYGMTMKQVLDIAQALYDKYELITYPRSDTGYLPVAQHGDGPGVISTIITNMPSLGPAAENCDHTKVSRAFNDKKVSAHHAIIPTQKASPGVVSALNDAENKVYELICIRYLMQFHSDAEYAHRAVEIKDDNGESHKATSKVYTVLGWMEINTERPDEDSGDNVSSALPVLAEGDAIEIVEISAVEKTTQPPKHYTDATLLDAMTNIHRHVEDAEVAKHLREGEGIGTEATRADIIEKLVNHGLVIREAKYIKSTEEGKFHCRLMPGDLTTPDMAGLFEYSTRQVESGDMDQADFLQFIAQFIVYQINNSNDWIEKAKQSGVEFSGPKCRNCHHALKKGKAVKTKAKLWICKSCDSIYMDEVGLPGFCVKGDLREKDQEDKNRRLKERMKNAPPCPNCDSPILKEKSKNRNLYWACRSCQSLFSDFGGEIGPAFKLNGEMTEPAADGPACPQCKYTMHRRVSKKRQPMFVCNNCDSMAWSNKGQLGEFFKVKGEMQNSRSSSAEQKKGEMEG